MTSLWFWFISTRKNAWWLKCFVYSHTMGELLAISAPGSNLWATNRRGNLNHCSKVIHSEIIVPGIPIKKAQVFSTPWNFEMLYWKLTYPPVEKDNHRLKSVLVGYMSVPRRVSQTCGPPCHRTQSNQVDIRLMRRNSDPSWHQLLFAILEGKSFTMSHALRLP